MRAHLKGVNTVSKRGRDGIMRYYHYHRATNKRLVGDFGTPEFLASYAEAEKSMRDRLSGTFSGLIRDYTRSVEFEKHLARSTQGEYRRMLRLAENEFSDLPVVALNDSRIRKEFLDWREKISSGSGEREADNRLSAISAMLTWGVNRGRVTVNHLKGFKRLYHSDRSEIIWLPEHIDAFMKAAPLSLQQALLLALHTGQRQGDLLNLPWSAYDGNMIRLRQGKARRGQELGSIIEIPCTDAVRKMLDSMPRVSPNILTTKTGRPFKKRYFIKLWNSVTEAAGLDCVRFPNTDKAVKLHFHDLRGTTVTLLSEAGCTPQQVASITGHSLMTVNQILEHYLARTRGLSTQAIANFENSPRTKFANQLQTDGPARTNGNEK